MGETATLLSKAALQQLPIHWFTMAVLSVAKISRHMLAQENWPAWAPGWPPWRTNCAPRSAA
jgi:two-component system CAI-1 autoinducer sensor kinase/phosphatase CqsS